MRLLVFAVLCLFSCAVSQVPTHGGTPPAGTSPAVTSPAVTSPAVTSPAVKSPAVTTRAVLSRDKALGVKSSVGMRKKVSTHARASLREARAFEVASRQVSGPERSRRLEIAAAAFERLVVSLDAEPEAAAEAAWWAAEIWRRHASPPLAEMDYLYAARADAVRYGQRGLLGAADMQLRQLRYRDAMKTYDLAQAKDPRTTHAHKARIACGRILLMRGKAQQAIERFQSALESAPRVSQAIDTADYLAKAWIKIGQLDSAGFVIEHAHHMALEAGDGDPVLAERLWRAYERMGSRKALQRARDKIRDSAADAVRLDEQRRRDRK
jgi:tetratricopeptide (TPR) repeat protein